MKVCRLCKESYDLDFFHKNNSYSDGLDSRCKSCRHEIRVKNYNYESWRLYYQENKDRILKYSSEWAKKNKNRKLKVASEWRKTKPLYLQLKAVNDRLRATKNTPSWLTESHKDHISQFYKAAHELTLFYGIKYEVDHIEPIKGKTVCGLHVPWNLQILTQRDNRVKNNKLIP